MAKYTYEFKLKAVNLYLLENESSSAISKKLNLNISVLFRWIKGYQLHGATSLKRKRKLTRYSSQFKLDVIRARVVQNLSYPQILAKYNISSAKMVMDWVNLYNEHGFKAIECSKLGRPTMKDTITTVNKKDNEKTSKELLEELKFLRAENDYLKKMKALVKNKKAIKKKQ